MVLLGRLGCLELQMVWRLGRLEGLLGRLGNQGVHQGLLKGLEVLQQCLLAWP